MRLLWSFLPFREGRLGGTQGGGQVLPYLQAEKTRGLSGQAVGRLTGGSVRRAAF